MREDICCCNMVPQQISNTMLYVRFLPEKNSMRMSFMYNTCLYVNTEDLEKEKYVEVHFYLTKMSDVIHSR